jgi:hypothetical protein
MCRLGQTVSLPNFARLFNILGVLEEYHVEKFVIPGKVLNTSAYVQSENSKSLSVKCWSLGNLNLSGDASKALEIVFLDIFQDQEFEHSHIYPEQQATVNRSTHITDTKGA